MSDLVLVPIGVAVGLVGALIGVGGGFFVVPFLLRVWKPGTFTPETATASSLGIVLVSALSGTWANARRKRIDVRMGLVLAAGTLPGAWVGRRLHQILSDRAFAWSFAALLTAVALYLVLVKLKPGKGLLRGTSRELVDSDGQAHRYELNAAAGVISGTLVGVVSSLFGVGGGLILVPFMVVAYGAPTVVATATSQFAFIFTSLVGLGVSLIDGHLTPEGWKVVGLMGLGVALGAQIGVAIAKKVPERVVRGILAAVIVGVAVSMVRKGG
ncbi:MAG TPA: sulfite exporter TauE/SafE family protein [Planctomycetota bacterium]